MQAIIAAGNRIAKTRYIWGGGHRRWEDRGYDCSGSVSYALHGAGLLDSSMVSGGFMRWGEAGPGRWVTIYAHRGHMYMVVAGLRFDTSGQRQAGTRWQAAPRSARGFRVRHPPVSDALRADSRPRLLAARRARCSTFARMAHEHHVHEGGHDHVHGPGCGHVAVVHEGHLDYLHDGHLHSPHGDHQDEHVAARQRREPGRLLRRRTAARSTTPATSTAPAADTRRCRTATTSTTSSAATCTTSTTATAATTGRCRRPEDR